MFTGNVYVNPFVGVIVVWNRRGVKQTMFAHEMLREIKPKSFKVSVQTRILSVDGRDISERNYLELDGTPAAFRWMAKLMNEMADSAESTDSSSRGHSVVVSPDDLEQIELEKWDCLGLHCSNNN